MDNILIDLKFIKGIPDIAMVVESLDLLELNSERVMNFIGLPGIDVLEKSISNKHQLRLKIPFTDAIISRLLDKWKTRVKIPLVTRDNLHFTTLAIKRVIIESA